MCNYYLVKAKNIKSKDIIELKIFEDEDDENIILSTYIENEKIICANHIYFKAFQELKDICLSKGYGLLCLGSKLNAIQSPMAFSSDKIYIVELGKQARNMKSIFEYCDLNEFVHTKQQNRYFDEWIRSLKK